MNQKTKVMHNSRNQKSITQHYLRMNSPKNLGVFSISPATFFQKSTQASKSKMASPSSFTSTKTFFHQQQPASASRPSNSRNLAEHPAPPKPSIPSMFHRRNTHFGNVPLLSLKEAAATAAATPRV